jgi:hypothetical protein
VQSSSVPKTTAFRSSSNPATDFQRESTSFILNILSTGVSFLMDFDLADFLVEGLQSFVDWDAGDRLTLAMVAFKTNSKKI